MYVSSPLLFLYRTKHRSACAFPATKPTDHLERRDACPARMSAYRTDAARAKENLFDKPYHSKHYYLDLLATHPDYQDHGIDKELVNWGLEKEKKQGWNVMLFASPMGRRVYAKLGFKDVGAFRTQIEGEEEYLGTPGMVLEAGSW